MGTGRHWVAYDREKGKSPLGFNQGIRESGMEVCPVSPFVIAAAPPASGALGENQGKFAHRSLLGKGGSSIWDLLAHYSCIGSQRNFPLGAALGDVEEDR